MKKKSFVIVIGGAVLMSGILWSLYLFSQHTRCLASELHCTSSVKQTQTNFYLDVRENDEWAAGHVKGALHLKMSDILAGKYDAIPLDQPVYVYCRSGRRAGEVIQFLASKGFNNLINAGGLSDLENVEIVQGI